MKNWRKVLADKKGEEKLMVGFKRYKTDNDVELPNLAEFSGDKEPSKTGHPGKLEVKVYEEANKLMESDRKREDKTKGTSALMGEDVKRKDMAKHISEEKEHVKPSYAGKKQAGSYDLLRELSYLMNEIGVESDDLLDGLPEADYSKIMSNYKQMGAILEKIHMESIPSTSPKEVSPSSENTPSTWASKKTANVYLKCPHCGHDDDKYAFMPQHEDLSHKNLTQVLANCPHCDKSFPIAEGVPAYTGGERWVGQQYPARRLYEGKQKGWRKILAEDVSFKNKPDGTVQIDITSHPNEPLTQNPTTQQPAPMSPQDVQQKEQQTGTSTEASLNKESFVQPGQKVKHISSGLTGTVDKIVGKEVYVNTDNGSTAIWGLNEINAISAAPQTNTPAQNISQYFAGAKKWDIKKEGSLLLIGAECEKCVGIQIEKDGKVVEAYMADKNGHEWREIVNQSVWEEKLKDYSK
jgi:hypothetical protein